MADYERSFGEETREHHYQLGGGERRLCQRCKRVRGEQEDQVQTQQSCESTSEWGGEGRRRGPDA